MQVAFFDSKPYDRASFQDVNRNYGYSIRFLETKLNQETAVLAKDCPVVCVFVNDQVDRPAIDRLCEFGVKLIVLRCAGYNQVDLTAADGRIQIARVPDYSPYAVAEHAVALMMALNRKTHRAFVRTRENNFSLSGLIGFDFHGKTVGVIGAGKIGRVLIEICKGLGMQVLVYDVQPAEIAGVRFTDLSTLYVESDIISLHCPLTKETRFMIDADSIAQMKTGVMLINTSRGALVDTTAVIEGLKSQKIGSAGLDVYEEESEYFFEDHSTEILKDDELARILSFPNVLVTSHQAFLTREALYNIAVTTLENIRSFEMTGVPDHAIRTAPALMV